MPLPKKTVKFDLTSVDSNAFNLMGGFRRQAQREGWTQTEIEVVLNECKRREGGL
jgi:hypothetical protein